MSDEIFVAGVRARIPFRKPCEWKQLHSFYTNFGLANHSNDESDFWDQVYLSKDIEKWEPVVSLVGDYGIQYLFCREKCNDSEFSVPFEKLNEIFFELPGGLRSKLSNTRVFGYTYNTSLEEPICL